MNRKDPPADARNPITILTVVLVMTWAVLAGLAWLSSRSYRETETTTARRLRIEALRGSIVHLDEVLTMSARLAAFTGDPEWENRYRRFEPQLDAAIKEAMTLAPEAFSTEAVAETDAANIRLVEMENHAFDLVRQSRAEEAKAVLFSDEYESQKRIYAEGMNEFATGLADSVSTALNREQRLPLLQAGALLLLMPFLIVGWLVVHRAVRNWETTLAEQAEELVEVNQSLDQKVARRTEAFRREAAERRAVEEQLTDAHAELEQQLVELEFAQEESFGMARDAEDARRKAVESEQAMRQSEVRHRTLFESSRDAIMTLAPPSWEFTSGNPATFEMFGARDEAEFVSLGPWDLSPEFQPDGRPSGEKAGEMIERAMKEGTNFFEWQHKRLDGPEFPATVLLTRAELGDQVFLQGTVRNISERKQAEETLRLSRRFLEIANQHTCMEPLLSEIAAEVQSLTGCEAVGIRMLNDEGGIPYEAHKGFSRSFLELESPLSIKVDQCMCLTVIKEETDPKLPFYTEGGSFYMNGTTRFLAAASEAEKGRTRNVCNEYGYESVALVPIRVGGRILGLIHLADHSENMVPAETVEVLERVAANLSAAIQRVETGELLRESEQRFMDVLYAADDAILLIDGEKFVDCNEATARMLGYPGRDDFLMTHISELSPPEQPDGRSSIEKAGDMIRTAFEKGFHRFEWMHRKADGEDFPVEVSFTPITYQGKTILHCLWRDLTEHKNADARRKQLQCELAHAQKLESVGQLAAGIAHEINTPTQYLGDNTRFLKDAFGDISAVLDGFEKLLQACKDGTVDEQLVAEVEATSKQADVEYLKEEIPQAIDQSLNGVERVANIVRAMKEFSHPGGKERSLVNLREAIETTITVARNEWKYVAEMVTDFDPELPEVSCLPGELNQVFLNLIVNAAHAIGDALSDDGTERGTITVGTRRDGEWAEIIVRDTGTGIPEDVRARIFDPFFTTKGVGKGTGQGLAIARSVVVDKHGGTIDCETEQGKGTTFIVRLPIDEKRQTQGASEYDNACLGV